MAKQKKSRYWAFLMYPDSRPVDWEDQLQSTGLPIAISPLHDRDTNDDGTIKKPHWHVLLCFDGPTTLNCIQDISARVNGTTIIPVNSVRGMYRYHLHEDNPEKFEYWKYPEEYQRTFINGFDIKDYSSLTSQEEVAMHALIFRYINEQKIFEYSDLVDYCMNEDMQAFDFVVHHTLVFNSYCASRRHKMKIKKEL